MLKSHQLFETLRYLQCNNVPMRYMHVRICVCMIPINSICKCKHPQSERSEIHQRTGIQEHVKIIRKPLRMQM